jgi:hypothetical protein
MKRYVLSFALGFLTCSSYASLPVSDPFANATASGGTSYAIGSNLIGQTNGQGLAWFQAGANGTQPQPTITSGNLSVNGLMPSTGNSVSYGGASGDSARLGLGTTVTSGTLYYSVALDVTSLGGLTTGGAIIFGFNNSTGSQTTQPTVIGTSLEIRLSGTGFNLGVNKNTGTATTDWDSTDVFSTGTTLFLVGGYTFNTASATDDVSSLWINPDSSTFGSATAPTATLTTSSGNDITGNQIASVLVREASTIEPNLTIDDVRAGASYGDVTPAVPEPSALALSVVGIVAGFGMRRFRRK